MRKPLTVDVRGLRCADDTEKQDTNESGNPQPGGLWPPAVRGLGSEAQVSGELDVARRCKDAQSVRFRRSAEVEQVST